MRVCPSGLDAATMPPAIVPPALGRLSTITCCPQDSVSFGPIKRERTSLALPAENGTMIRMGRAGNDWAAASWAKSDRHASTDRHGTETFTGFLLASRR